MYCSYRNCYKEAATSEENWNGLCLEHYQKQKETMSKQNDDYQDKLKKNLESLKKVEERIKARKEDNTK